MHKTKGSFEYMLTTPAVTTVQVFIGEIYILHFVLRLVIHAVYAQSRYVNQVVVMYH